MIPDYLMLPSIESNTMAPPSIRSMDEINKWIEEDYELFFDRKAYEMEKRDQPVAALFTL